MGVSIGPRIGIDGEREYVNSIKNIVQETKTLDAEMKSVSASFDGNTDALKENEKYTSLLQEKKEALQKQVNKTREMVEKSAASTGENSTATLKWKEALANAETQLTQVTHQLEGQKTATTESKASLDDITEAQKEVGDGSGVMAQLFGGSISNISAAVVSGNVAGLLSDIIGKINEVSAAVAETEIKFEESAATIAAMTGETSDSLERMAEVARKAWADVAGAELPDVSVTTSMLSTRFGISEDSFASVDEFEDYLGGLTEAFTAYAKVTGQSGAEAVNNIADIMMQYGLFTDDAAQNAQSMYDLMDTFTRATQLSNVSASEFADFLIKDKSAIQDFGIGMDDAIGLMINFAQSGRDASELTAGLQKAYVKLADETDNLSGAWESAQIIMGGVQTTQEKLNQEIGVTGTAVVDAFGKKAATGVIEGLTAMKSGVGDWSAGLKDASGSLSEAYYNSITLSDGWQQVSSELETRGFSWLTPVLEKNEGFKNQIAGYYQDLSKVTASEVGKIDSAGVKMATRTDATRKSVNSSMVKMYGDTKTYLDNISRSYATVQPTLHVKAPYLTPVVAAGGTIDYNVQYRTYARGYNSPILLNGATIFGTMGGSLLSGGEHGTEVVVGESYLLNAMTEAVRIALASPNPITTNNTYEGASVTVNVYGAPGQDIKELSKLVAEQINKGVKAKVALRG